MAISVYVCVHQERLSVFVSHLEIKWQYVPKTMRLRGFDVLYE